MILPNANLASVDPNDYPFVVVLVRANDPLMKPMCHGVAIAPHWVLTAGHCVDDELEICPRHKTCRVRMPGVRRSFEYDAPKFNGYRNLTQDTENDFALLRIRNGPLRELDGTKRRSSAAARSSPRPSSPPSGGPR